MNNCVMRGVLAVLVATGGGGCVNVSAPDKPIEINLNINVKQEVVYRLDGEAKATIKENPGIF
ncbi:YnbE family lipoprotein [Sphingomonas aracearum]|uniref:YnbE family lipoprotein n=1 Tax=Sphingomonas aracearum TaxID=2283317 RepID=A0A369VZ86_9SPHN|nr:YnbE family lipoprotein [Sphingomonas aracearum]RDE06947.1 YnbE family lipoprotein [Sphingomonas aracearum]